MCSTIGTGARRIRMRICRPSSWVRRTVRSRSCANKNWRDGMTPRLSFIAALVLIAIHPISAHHSVKGTYDTSALVTLTGTVAKVDFVNPHVWFELTVKREDGQVI